MNLNELDSFRLSDSIQFHDELNPEIFTDDKLNAEVRQQLLAIADDFLEHLGVDSVDVKDITLSGSNAAYTYTPHSDLDLHILVDIGKLKNDDIYRELFNSKKLIYNDSYDITIHDMPVELYVQDSAEPVKSLGEYSVKRDRWIKYPVRRKANLDQTVTKEKFKKLVQLSELALRSQDEERVANTIDRIRRYRQTGLDKGGEFAPENLAFKALRSQGIVDKLYRHQDRLHSLSLSLDEDDEYGNQTPPGPEFKPTMPAGTVKVDVSDVYDWYKLGQHISNLKGLGKHDFGAGPPSTIFSFGSEDQEHKYIDALKKTGLSTTDIDPFDPNQPKGMPRQKVDPTYNVAEQEIDEAVPGLKFLRPNELSGSWSPKQLLALGFRQARNGSWFIAQDKWDKLVRERQIYEASGYIPSEREKNDPRFKTALTVDVHPDAIKQNAAKLGLGKIKRTGVPPIAQASGKIK